MKYQYIGCEKKKDKEEYRIFLLKKNEAGEGMKPVMIKYGETFGYPTMKDKPTVKVGAMVDIFYDDRLRIDSFTEAK